jgi:enamine deaminase RidA (YjgF/YER057c/UK114 family)
MKIVNPTSLGKPHGYSNGILYPLGQILFVSGQIGWDASRNLANGLTAQFVQALRNVLDVVREAGGNPESIGRLTMYVTDKQEYLRSRKEIGEAYRSIMGRHFPAMSLVIAKDLLEEGALIEIEATAVIS